MNVPVQIIKSSNLRQFFHALQRRGEVFTLKEMHTCNNKESFKIAVGILRHKFQFVEQGKRKLLKIDLIEVHYNGRKGKLFHLYLFGSFAVAFKDLKLKKNACVAFRSAVVEKYTSYHTYKGHHDLQAFLGCPDRKGVKIFLFVEKNKNMNNFPAIPAQDGERPGTSAQIAPVKEVYKYKRISELTVSENNVNIYGVVSQILRGANDPHKHAVLRLKDETCKEDEDFEVHIFFGNDRINPRFAVDDIVRLHRMQVREYSGGKMGGRIFRASDMVTEKEGAYSRADCDKLAQATLRLGIDSRRKEKRPVLTIGNISEEGTYTVGCQVQKIYTLSDDILILAATDWDLGDNQTKKNEVHIIAVAAPAQLQTIPLHTNVILDDVKVREKDKPIEGRSKFAFKMQGPLYTFEVLRGSEEKATSARTSNSSSVVLSDDSSERLHRSTSRVASRKRNRNDDDCDDEALSVNRESEVHSRSARASTSMQKDDSSDSDDLTFTQIAKKKSVRRNRNDDDCDDEALSVNRESEVHSRSATASTSMQKDDSSDSDDLTFPQIAKKKSVRRNRNDDDCDDEDLPVNREWEVHSRSARASTSMQKDDSSDSDDLTFTQIAKKKSVRRNRNDDDCVDEALSVNREREVHSRSARASTSMQKDDSSDSDDLTFPQIAKKKSVRRKRNDDDCDDEALSVNRESEVHSRSARASTSMQKDDSSDSDDLTFSQIAKKKSVRRNRNDDCDDEALSVNRGSNVHSRSATASTSMQKDDSSDSDDLTFPQIAKKKSVRRNRNDDCDDEALSVNRGSNVHSRSATASTSMQKDDSSDSDDLTFPQIAKKKSVRRNRNDDDCDDEALSVNRESKVHTRSARSSTYMQKEDSSDTDDLIFIQLAKKKIVRKRRAYTEEERKLIVQYISRKKAHGYVKGREFWVKMEAKKVVPGRTWQSLKEHYCKQIIPSIDHYVETDEEAKKFKQPFHLK